MFKAIAQIFITLETFFRAFTRLANATDHLAATAEDRASAFRDEQSEENRLRIEKLKAKVKHNKENPQEFVFEE